MHTIRRATHVVLLGGAALLLAGCGSSSDGTAGPDRASSVQQGAARILQCRTPDLKVSLSRGEGAAGSTFFHLFLTNTSKKACRTRGYGGVSLVRTAEGDPIGAPADRTAQDTVRRITLRPGQKASATLQETTAENFPVGKCRPTQARGFRVYPPDETRSAFVSHPSTACRNAAVHLLTLSPYQPVR